MAFNEQEQQIIQWGTKNGKSPQEIKEAVFRYRTTGSPTDPSKPQPKQESSFLGGIAQDFTNRVNQASDAQIEAVEGKRSDVSAIGRTLGAGARFAGDIAGRAVSAAIPDAAEDAIASGVAKIAATPTAQAGIQKYQDLKQQYPELVQGLEDIGAIASTFMAPGAANLATKGVLSVAEQSAKTLSGINKVGAQGIKEAAENAIDPASLMQRVARVSKGKQAAFEDRSGQSIGQYLVDRRIFGDIDQITTQLYQRLQTSKGEVDKALDSLPGEYKNVAVGSALKELAKREQSVSTPGALSKDIERVRELLKKHNGAGLSMSEINEVKRLYERNVKLDYLKENIPTNVERANNIDSSIREWQQNMASQLGFKNIQQLNRETMLSKQLLDDLGAEYAGSAGNNAITLTDWVLLAGTASEPSTAIGSFLAKRTLTSKPVMSKLAEMFSKGQSVPDPKAQMGAPTIDNYIKWVKSITTEPTIDVDTPVLDTIKSAQPGLSTRAIVPTPQKFAEQIDIADYKAIKEYIAAEMSGQEVPFAVYEAVQNIFERRGLGTPAAASKGKMPRPTFVDSDAELDYLQQVANAYDDL